MVSAALGTGIAFADAVDLPRFVDAQDACETLWRSEKCEQLYGYIDELKQKSPDYAPVVFLSATRERKFGGQYEEESAQLRSLTNRLHQVLCEVNPEALPRLGAMADDADESVRLCEKLGQDREYRRIHSNPLKTRRKTHVPCLPCCFVDIAFLLPDMSLSNNSPSVNLRLPAQERRKALDARVLGAKYSTTVEMSRIDRRRICWTTTSMRLPRPAVQVGLWRSSRMTWFNSTATMRFRCLGRKGVRRNSS